jgi:hypothetical protein
MVAFQKTIFEKRASKHLAKSNWLEDFSRTCRRVMIARSLAALWVARNATKPNVLAHI